MADQTKILKALCATVLDLTIDEIAKGCGIRVRVGKTRKQLLQAIGKLMSKKLVARAGVRTQAERGLANMCGEEPRYFATLEGRNLVAAGKRVTSGPNGPHAAPRKPEANTQREKFWKALRIARKATLADLAEAACGKNDDPAKAMANARRYLKALCAGGIVSELPVRARGHAPTSPGFKRFVLVRDLGIAAPVAAKNGVFDPNARETIPYAQKETKR